MATGSCFHGAEETLLEYFFRQEMLYEKKDKTTHTTTLWMEGEAELRERLKGERGADLREIERFVVDTGLRPEAVLVKYGDEFSCHIIAIEENPQPATKRGEAVRKVENLFQYLAQVREELAQSQAHRQLPSCALSFQEIQEHTEWVEVKNLMGDKVRLAGVTPASFDLVLERAITFFVSRGSKLENLLFYGSRVMTRDEVMQRQPDLVGVLPLQEFGVVKNGVRQRGAKISDWQIRFIYDELSYPFGDSAMEKNLYRELSRWLRSQFGTFPVSAALIPTPAGASLEEQFQAALKRLRRKGKMGDPRAQYASLSHMEWWNDFPQGSGRLPCLEELWVKARASVR